MRFRFLLVAPLLALAGCITALDPLVTPATAAWPFTSITLADERGGPVVVARQSVDPVAIFGVADYYLIAGEEGGTRILLLDYGDGLYLVQSSGPRPDGTEGWLYAAIRIDRAAMTVSLYRTQIREEDFAAGLPQCVENGQRLFYGCLADGRPLITIVEAAIAAGEPPEAVFPILAIN